MALLSIHLFHVYLYINTLHNSVHEASNLIHICTYIHIYILEILVVLRKFILV